MAQTADLLAQQTSWPVARAAQKKPGEGMNLRIILIIT